MHELPDKTKINYWYKLPHEMLQHYTPNLFSHGDFLDISGVDITVGGDHGKGKRFLQATIFINCIQFIIYPAISLCYVSY